MIHEDMRSFYNGFPRDAHPMAILSSVVGRTVDVLPGFARSRTIVEQVEISIYRLLAKLPTIAAYSYKKSIGQPFIYPKNDLTYCENFLAHDVRDAGTRLRDRSRFRRGAEPAVDRARRSRTELQHLDGADGRVSSNANLFASISAGIGALWGPLHGGANEACVEHARTDRSDGGNVKKYVDMAKDKDEQFPPDGLRASRLQELRSAGDDHPRVLRQAAGETEHRRSAFRGRPRAWKKSR